MPQDREARIKLTAIYNDRGQLSHYVTDMKKAARATEGLEKSMRRQERQFSRSRRVTAGFTGDLRGLRSGLSLVGASLVTRELAQYADEWTNVQNRIRVAAGTQLDFKTGVEDVRAIARDTRAPLRETALLYSRVAQAADDMTLSQSEVARITTIAAQAIAIQGSTTIEAQGALIQFGQLLGGARVEMQEFRSIVDGARPIIKAAAKNIKEAGGSVGVLRELVRDGKISSELFAKALLQAGDDIAIQFGSVERTVSQNLTIIRNELISLIGRVNEGTGATKSFSEATDKLADKLSDPETFRSILSSVETLIERVKITIGLWEHWISLLKETATFSFDNIITPAVESAIGLLESETFQPSFALGAGGIAPLGINKTAVRDAENFGRGMEGLKEDLLETGKAAKQVALDFQRTLDLIGTLPEEVGRAFALANARSKQILNINVAQNGFLGDRDAALRDIRESWEAVGDAVEDISDKSLLAVKRAIDERAEELRSALADAKVNQSDLFAEVRGTADTRARDEIAELVIQRREDIEDVIDQNRRLENAFKTAERFFGTEFAASIIPDGVELPDADLPNLKERTKEILDDLLLADEIPDALRRVQTLEAALDAIEEQRERIAFFAGERQGVGDLQLLQDEGLITGDAYNAAIDQVVEDNKNKVLAVERAVEAQQRLADRNFVSAEPLSITLFRIKGQEGDLNKDERKLQKIIDTLDLAKAKVDAFREGGERAVKEAELDQKAIMSHRDFGRATDQSKESLRTLLDQTEQYNQEIKGLRLEEEFKRTTAEINRQVEALRSGGPAALQFEKQLIEAENRIEKIGSKAGITAEQLARWSSEAERAKQELKGVELAVDARRAVDEANELVEALRNGGIAAYEFQEALQAARAELRDIGPGAGLSAEELARLRIEAQRISDEADKIKEKVEAVGVAAADIADQVRASFSDILFDPSTDNFRAALLEVVQSVRRAVADQLAEKLFEGIEKTIEGLLKKIPGLFTTPEETPAEKAARTVKAAGEKMSTAGDSISSAGTDIKSSATNLQTAAASLEACCQALSSMAQAGNTLGQPLTGQNLTSGVVLPDLGATVSNMFANGAANPTQTADVLSSSVQKLPNIFEEKLAVPTSGLNAAAIQNELAGVQLFDSANDLTGAATLLTASAAAGGSGGAGGGGGLFGGNFVNGLAGSLGSLAGTFLANEVINRGAGGPVAAGQIARVGERGEPEIFVDRSGKQYMIPPEGGVVNNISDEPGRVQNISITQVTNVPTGGTFKRSRRSQNIDLQNNLSFIR